LSLAIDKLQLEIAFLLGVARELTAFVCNVGQKIFVSHALQFVDMLEKFPIVCVYVCRPLFWGDSFESVILWKPNHSRFICFPFYQISISVFFGSFTFISSGALAINNRPHTLMDITPFLSYMARDISPGSFRLLLFGSFLLL
jgi:hypothetical protein